LRHLVRNTGYEAGIGIPRLLGKASNTSFSRHNKTGCNLPVCTTSFFDQLAPKNCFWGGSAESQRAFETQPNSK